MKRFSFRIRKRYFDQIVSAKKQIEYRRDSPFWRARLGRLEGRKAIAVFICGKRVHRRWILSARLVLTPDTFSEQGKQDVDTTHCWAIRLGAEAPLGELRAIQGNKITEADYNRAFDKR